ncbi:uncharacterized protein LOC110093390 [Dendrobium catenatum]|uniref:uncharacterized protein LOC110093390 n=1 Tax=Dendrobium catenatum TaxID=906689 RepID=UPI0009F6CEB4|nr:uncharacterized protein LOC110093390 [Dendrobium catenatum]
MVKANNKLNMWGNRFLSQVGKLTLIKSSFLNHPLFLAAHSLIPLQILKDFEYMCRSFLWHNINGKSGMHYVPWKVLCAPKTKGGWGLHSVIEKIGPLRAKFAWRFISNPNSFLNRSLIAIYGNDPWKVDNRSCNSPSWKIIRHGAASLLPIIRWNIGNGSNISILKDVWLLDRRIDRWPTYVNCSVSENGMVSDLIKNGVWDMAALQCNFGVLLIELIIQIHVNTAQHEDYVELMYKLSGKTIAALATEYVYKNEEDVDFLNWLVNTERCPRGCLLVEDGFHVAVKCKKLIQVLAVLATWGFAFPILNSFEDCLSRNKGNHGGSEHGDSFIIVTAVSYAAASFCLIHIKESWDTNQLFKLSPISWYPPPPGWLKVNLDASLSNSNLAGIGGVLRDSKGGFIGAFGISLVDIKMEGVNPKDFFYLKDFGQVVFQHVKREINRVADFCAKIAISNSFFWNSLVGFDIPTGFFALLKEDITGV